MFNFLSKLRQKPDKAKNRLAFFVAFLIAGIIFVVWLTAVYPQIGQKQSQTEKVATSEPSPTRALSDIIFSGFSNIREQFSKIKSVSSLLQSSPDYYTATTTTSF